MMMHRTTFILSIASLALLLLLASLPRVEAATLRRENDRALEREEARAPSLKLEPPSEESAGGGTVTTTKVGRHPRLGATSTSTTTATATSVTTTTTMMIDEGEMSPSELYLIHHREHGMALLALEEEAAAAEAPEENYLYYDDDEREPRKQRRRRGQRGGRQLGEIFERQREMPRHRQQQEQQEQQTSPPEAEKDYDEDEDPASAQQEEQVGAVVETAGGSTPMPSSSSPTGDNDGDVDGHAADGTAASVNGTPPPSLETSATGDIDGSDVAVTITDDCNVDRPNLLGDGLCNYDSETRGIDGYNTAECGWDGGDCCYQTCRGEWCGNRGFVCLDPRFSGAVYDEEGEQDPQRRRERQALRALYDATNGEGWNDQGQWLDDTLDHCYWDTSRIGCTGREGYVWALFLSDRKLTGTLPTEVGQLVHLEYLLLAGNQHLSGTIPASIGELTELDGLVIRGTSLSGPVPANAMVPIFGTPRWYYSPYNTDDDYAELPPHDCADVVGWTDTSGNDCDWYANHTSSCATDGMQHGNMGHTADTACCACGLFARYDREGEVLVELYGATHGEGWLNSSLWTDINSGHCGWTGVQCNDDDMVTHLALASNNLRGSIPTNIRELRSLRILNVSDNFFEESPLIKIGELRSLQILDVSNNGISGGIPTEVYTLMNLEELYLRNVSLGGTVPITQLASLSLLRRLDLSQNELTGTISAEFGRMSRLRRLDLDSNRLEGSIPADIGLMSLLQELRISNQEVYQDRNLDWHESISGPIPLELGDCQYLEVLDLSENWLTGVLPTELARLTRMKWLLLHENTFENYIPSEYGLLTSLENLTLDTSGSAEKKRKPAPLSLCFNEAFDLHSDPLWCPPERNALKHLYDATGGDGWSNSDNWIHPHDDYCAWYGVGCSVGVSCRDVPDWTDSYGNDCDDYVLDPRNCTKNDVPWHKHNNHTANTACCVCQEEKYGCFWNGTECIERNVTSLSLVSNGLSGPLPAELFELDELDDLRLGNNRLVGTLPEIVHKKLKIVQLSGNELSGEIPLSITELTSLSLLHLHGNRFTTGVPTGVTASNMTADCGEPYYYGDKLSCDNCDICCNSEGNCLEKNKKRLDLPEQTGLFLGCMMASLIVLYAIVLTRKNSCIDLPPPARSAVEYCGEGSVYRFFLTESFWAWILTLATLAAQVLMFSIFLMAANVDFDISDWEYHLRCPPNQLSCENDKTVDFMGWMVFGLLMVAFLGKDLISGVMLVYSAGSRDNIFSFVSGFFISVVTGYAVWTSAQYNLAIATSNTALVANAVILLFVNDIDERIFELSVWLFPEWVAKITRESKERSASIFPERSTTEEHTDTNADENDSEVIQKLHEHSSDSCSDRRTTEEHTGDSFYTAEIDSVAGEQKDQEFEALAPCRENLHALFAKKSEIEELRAQMKELKIMLCKGAESTSKDD